MRISDWSSDVCSTDHLWSTRAIVAWEPSDRFRANIIWQHFEEDDNRSRTGKQLCTRDPGPATIGGVVVPENLQGRLSQGCLPGSLYRSEEHTSELQSLMRISYAVLCLKTKKNNATPTKTT